MRRAHEQELTGTRRRGTAVSKRLLLRAATLLSVVVGVTVSSTAVSAHAAPATLPTYSDYSAVNTAPNGVATPIRYGTTGKGNPTTRDCTVTVSANPQASVDKAAARHRHLREGR